MKIAVLSDIHGNLPALEVVIAHIEAWRPDVVIVNGDVVNRGPNSHKCWERIAHKIDHEGWRMTRGNHEDFVTGWKDPQPHLLPVEAQLYQSARWAYEQFSAESIQKIESLPFELTQQTDNGGVLRAAHASPRGNRDSILPWTTNAEISDKVAPFTGVFVTSHTHRAFQRQVDNMLVVNCGSVGVPLDCDPRAGYAQLVWHKGAWRANLLRLRYDRAQTHRDFLDCNFNEVAGPSGLLMYREWRDARSYIPFWTRRYREQVIAGELDADESVRLYFASLG